METLFIIFTKITKPICFDVHIDYSRGKCIDVATLYLIWIKNIDRYHLYSSCKCSNSQSKRANSTASNTKSKKEENMTQILY